MKFSRYHLPTIYFYVVALIFTLFGRALFPSLGLVAPAPLMTLLIIQGKFKKALWTAIFFGWLMDLMGQSHPFGIFPLCLGLTTCIAFPQRRTFFLDKPLSLPLFSTLFALIFSLLCSFCFWLLSGSSLKNRIGDALWTLPIDTLYAFIFYVVPVMAFRHLSLLYFKWKRKSYMDKG